MTNHTRITVAMFAVADQDAAVRFYTETLGWEVRSDVSFGAGADAGRWVEVAPHGSAAGVALNPPMGGRPGGGGIGMETDDLAAERERLRRAGVEITNETAGAGPVPAMFAVHDPDGNGIWVISRAA